LNIGDAAVKIDDVDLSSVFQGTTKA